MCNRNNDKGIFDGIIPDITGDGKADILDAIIIDELIFHDEDEEDGDNED